METETQDAGEWRGDTSLIISSNGRSDAMSVKEDDPTPGIIHQSGPFLISCAFISAKALAKEVRLRRKLRS